MAKWLSEDPRTREWTPYDPSDTALLEKAYTSGQTTVTLDFAGSKFTVDVKKMTQSNSSGGSRKVRRDAPPTASAKVVTFVNGITSATNGVLTMDSFGDFFGALGVDLATAAPFILFHKFGVKGCWSATAEELRDGFAAAAIEPTPAAVSTALKRWTTELQDPTEFAAFHEFVFKFVRSSTSAKAVAFEEIKEPAKVCLSVFKKFLVPPERVLDFLEKKNKPVALDLWKMTFRFCSRVKADFSNYDADDMWPAAIDDFVEAAKAGTA